MQGEKSSHEDICGEWQHSTKISAVSYFFGMLIEFLLTKDKDLGNCCIVHITKDLQYACTTRLVTLDL